MTTRVDINLENVLIVRKIRETIINDIVTLIVNDKTFWNKNNKALVYNLSGPETELHLPEELQTNIANVIQHFNNKGIVYNLSGPETELHLPEELQTNIANVIQHFNNNTLSEEQLDNIMKFDNVRSKVHTISYAHKIDLMSYFEVKLIEENNTIDDISLVKFLHIFRLLQPLLIKSNVFSEYYLNYIPMPPMPPMPINLYNILNLNKDASIKDIKKAYKKLAMIHHPDRGGDEEKFKEINIAHETLTDPTKKNNYDRTGEISGGRNVKTSKKKTSKKKTSKKKTSKKKTNKKKTNKKKTNKKKTSKKEN